LGKKVNVDIRIVPEINQLPVFSPQYTCCSFIFLFLILDMRLKFPFNKGIVVVLIRQSQNLKGKKPI
jgi:hypothetical protein